MTVGRREGSRSRTPAAVSPGREDRGAVTAEAAAVLPVLVAVVVALLWLLSLTAAQIRMVDSAREVARVVARGESESVALAAGRRVAPEHTDFAISRSAEQVRVEAVAHVSGPGGLFGFLPAVRVDSTAVAVREPGAAR